MDSSAREHRVDRRSFILGGASAALGALTLAEAGPVAAHDDVTPGVIIGKVVGHPNAQSVDIVEAGTARRVTVTPPAGASAVNTEGHARRLAAIPVGSTVAAEAPPQDVATTEANGTPLPARLIAPCILGLASEVVPARQ